MPANENLLNELLAQCDQCVKCGLCLPACPTYNLYSSESDSPRGRIALVQGLARGDLSPTDTAAAKHLDRCLSCGACETACPSGVAYLDILDQTRAGFSVRHFPQWQLDLLANAASLRRLLGLARYVPESILTLFPASARRMIRIAKLPKATSITPLNHSSHLPAKGKIALFTGCAGRVFDRNAIFAFSELAHFLGYEVIEPENDCCCGALHLHEGYPERAEQHLGNTSRSYEDLDVDAVVYFASACGIRLKQIKEHSPLIFREATGFLAELLESADLPELKPPETIMAVHTPCTLQHQSADWPRMHSILHQLAGDKLVPLPDNPSCCGGAGLHMIKHPDAASELLDPKLKALTDLKPAILLTSNTGCSMHFMAGLSETGLNIEVLHPVEWISRHILSQLMLQNP